MRITCASAPSASAQNGTASAQLPFNVTYGLMVVAMDKPSRRAVLPGCYG